MLYERHGHAQKSGLSPEYQSWRAVKKRCLDPGNRAYPIYGGVGIGMCERWAGSFQAFLQDMGPRPLGTSIDRIDNAKGYEPGNCRWATPTEQANNRRQTIWLEHNGTRMPLGDWSKKYGVPTDTLWHRLKKGWAVSDAITTPVRKR